MKNDDKKSRSPNSTGADQKGRQQQGENSGKSGQRDGTSQRQQGEAGRAQGGGANQGSDQRRDR